MQRSYSNALVNGTVGGIAAGAAVALWFFVVDLTTAGLFHTPAALASVILGDESKVATFRLVAAYTILHFGVFALLGTVMAWLIYAIGTSPRLLLGALFGLGVLDSVYYGALLVTGANLFAVLPTLHVLAANLLGGMVLMSYLHYAMHAETPLGLGALREHLLLARGLVTGLIGAGTVAFWFLILDIWKGSPFYTPAALGSVVFFGAASPDEIQVKLGVIAAYTILHLGVFSVVGIGLAWTAERLERVPGMWLIALMAFIVLEGLFLGTVGNLGEWVLGALSWWAIGIGNLAAVVVMGGWVWTTHPKLRQQLLETPVNTLV